LPLLGGLGHQQPVKGVAVDSGKVLHRQHMLDLNW